jgi:hypothetical protein
VTRAQVGGGTFGRVIAQSRTNLTVTGVHLAPLGALVVELGG